MTPHEDAEALSAYLDGALDAAETSRVEEHVRSCEQCGKLHARLKAASAAVASLGKVSLGKDDSRELRQSVLQAAKKSTPWFTPARIAGVIGAAALVGAGIIGLSVITGTPSEEGTADTAQKLSRAAAPAAITEQSFNSPEELLAAAEHDPDVVRGAASFDASDVGKLQESALRRSTAAGEEAQADVASTESGGYAAATASPTPLWGCQRKALQEKPYPTMPVLARPALYKGEKAWMLVYAFTYSKEDNAALDHIRLQLVRRTDCSLLVEQIFKPS